MKKINILKLTVSIVIEKLYAVTFYSVLGLFIKYIVNYILVAIPSINIYGAIIGSIFGFGLPITLNTIYIQRNLKLKINLKSYAFKPLVSSIFMALVVFVIYNGLTFVLGFIFKGYFNNAIALLLSIILGMLTYLFSMILVKGITDSELAIIKSKIRRFIPNKIVYLYKYMIN